MLIQPRTDIKKTLIIHEFTHVIDVWDLFYDEGDTEDIINAKKQKY